MKIFGRSRTVFVCLFLACLFLTDLERSVCQEWEKVHLDPINLGIQMGAAGFRVAIQLVNLLDKKGTA